MIGEQDSKHTPQSEVQIFLKCILCNFRYIIGLDVHLLQKQVLQLDKYICFINSYLTVINIVKDIILK